MKNATTLKPLTARPWRFVSLLVALIWLSTQPAAGQLPGPLPTGLLGTPNISLTDIAVTYGDLETIQGQFTLLNISGFGQSVTLGPVAIALEYVGATGTTATCRGATVFTNLASSVTVIDGLGLPVTFSAVCTDGTPPLDTREIVPIVTIKLANSDTVFATSGRFQL